MPSPLLSVCAGLATFGQLSQASPTPSPSLSVWRRLGTVGQLSMKSLTRSLSLSSRWPKTSIPGSVVDAQTLGAPVLLPATDQQQVSPPQCSCAWSCAFRAHSPTSPGVRCDDD